MAQTRRISKNNTKIRTAEGVTTIRLHSTDIVSMRTEGRRVTVTLNSGGWHTSTTKTRMNQVFNQFDLPLRVFQRDFEWNVWTPDTVQPFVDGSQFTFTAGA